MAPKGPKAASNGIHTAGIYADMTVDGPEIGTLVVIIDRAKNLPNRKTMGKQDPYCAARLGKEAKKTETDRRGGQTPKWDQELRFTVHDSPDYYQLKVSVFNDDKKTELIGETWVKLEDVVVPGGGKDDQWHHLHCRGRFAGEIRIELTYYDTRPKDPKQDDRRPSETAFAPEQREISGGLGGPRQQKPVKRRPLPADPTQPPSDHPVGQPDSAYTRQQTSVPSQYSSSDLQQLVNSGPHGRIPQAEEKQYQQRQEQYGKQHYNRDSSPVTAPSRQLQHQVSEARVGLNHYYEPHHSPFGEPEYDQRHSDYTQCLIDGPHPQSSLQEYRHNNASGPSTSQLNGQHQAHSPHTISNSAEGLSTQEYHEPSYWQQHEVSRSDEHVQAHSYAEVDDDQGAPPPPPTHRYSGGVSPLEEKLPRHSDSCSSITGPAPLNVRSGRGSIPESPLSQVQATDPYQSYSSRDTQYSTRPHAQSISSSPSNLSYSQADRRYEHGSPSPVRDPYQATPPSLRAGFDPRIAEEESERMAFEGRMQDQGRPEAVPQYQAFSNHDTQRRAHPSPTRNQKPDQLRFLDDNHARSAHRASAPLPFNCNRSPDPPAPQAGHVSPDTKMFQRETRNTDLRIPIRKSISPQPAERRQSAIPFSPDSYDSLNPTLSSASSINFAGPKYNTPEQAREVAAQHERESKRPEGPIIGSDGRVIDPSDHLPTDTWAPEPDTKAPKKAAEVTVRFRRGPQGAQPMPANGRRPHLETAGRPHSVSTPPSATSSENILPTSSARARLQKRDRNLPTHPASSPTVPTIHTAARGSPLRNQASNTPLRKHEQYGYNNQTPYSRDSTVGSAPPVPGKIPLHAGHEDWNNRALSEEMSRIDIGVGGGARARRSRYGF